MKERASKVKTALCVSSGRVYNLLPDKDKASIMEKILQMPEGEVYKLTTATNTPSFVYMCAKLVEEGKLDVYLNALRQCREMCDKESGQTDS